jgi:protein-disulfide isomerase
VTVAKKNKKQTRSKPGPPAKKKSSAGFYMVLGGMALVGVVALLLLNRGGSGSSSLPPVSVAQTDVAPSGAFGVSMGPDAAPVRIVEFADFLCPACRNFNAVTGKLLRQNFAVGEGATLQWVNYDFPLHEQSWQPALAARCAEPSGKYWEMHDLLYARADDWATESNMNRTFVDFAETVGIDKKEFEACLKDRSGLEDIGASRKYGESLGVNATPTLFINGQKIPSERRYYSYEGMAALIQQAAAQAGEREAEPTESAEPAEAPAR